MERVRRLPVLAAVSRARRSDPGTRRHGAVLCMLVALALCIAALLGPRAARAVVFMTRDQALAQAFPGARIERRAFVLTEAQVAALEARARVRAQTRLVTAYLAWHGDTLRGTAFFDSRTVRTMPGVFMIVVAPDSTLTRVDVLAFHEPPEYQPPARWLGLLGRHRLDDRLWPERDIRTLSGATLSTRAVTEATRMALACWEVLLAPDGRPQPRIAR